MENDNVQRSAKKGTSAITIILSVVIGILIASLVFVTLYFTVLKDDQKMEPENRNPVENVDNDVKEEAKLPLDLNLNGEFVQSLYNKIPMTPFYPNIFGFQTSSQNTIPGYEKMRFVLMQLKNEKAYTQTSDENIKNKLKEYISSTYDYDTVDVYPMDLVMDRYYYIFGYGREVFPESINLFGYVFEYNEDNNCYYGHSYPGGGGGDINYVYKLIDAKANEDQTEIYLYLDYIHVIDRSHEKQGYIACPTYEWTNSIETFDGYEYNEEYKERTFGGRTLNQLLEQYSSEGKAGRYKVVYKLDSKGNYYWNSMSIEK